jgi:hypothetical protein
MKAPLTRTRFGISSVLTEARELVRSTGAIRFLPHLREVGLVGRKDPNLLAVGLREAETTYGAIGTPGHAH